MAEKQASACMHILSNQRAGGWGQKHLTKGFADMPYLATSSGRETNVVRIGKLVSEYYSSLFSTTPGRFAEEYTDLEGQLAADQTLDFAGC